MTTQRRVFDLRAHRDPVAGTIVANDGNPYDVFKFNGDQFQRVSQFDETTPVPALYDLVGEVVPTLSKDELLKLDKEQCHQILVLAGQGIEAVEALFPNVESPERQTSPG